MLLLLMDGGRVDILGSLLRAFSVAFTQKIKHYAIAADLLLPVSQEHFPTRMPGHTQLNTHKTS